MRKLRFSYLLVLPLVVALAACASTASRPIGTTSLWQVTSAHRTLYIASDTQLLSAKDYPLPPPITQAFSESGELIVEQLPVVGKKLQALILQRGLLPHGQTLEKLLTAAQLETLQAALKTADIPLARIEPLRPWLASFVLAGSSHIKLNIDPKAQLTEYFYQEATTQKMSVTPLEQGAEAIEMLADLPEKLQVELLIRSASAIAKLPKLRPLIVEAWRSGDTAAMAKYVKKSFRGLPKLYAKLVTKRNRTWLKTLEARLDSKGKPVFFVVGNGHLAGPGNLLAMLRADGYQVRQL